MKLRDLLDQVAEAAAYVAHRASEFGLDHYLSHFVTSESDDHEGYHVPKTHGFKIGDKMGVVPQASLANPVTTRLREFDVELETDVSLDKEKKLEISLTRGQMKRSSHMKIHAKFLVESSPEGLQIVQESFHTLTRDGMKTSLTETNQGDP